jgi:hypothetical protein
MVNTYGLSLMGSRREVFMGVEDHLDSLGRFGELYPLDKTEKHNRLLVTIFLGLHQGVKRSVTRGRGGLDM